jgi:hypothetical protein
MVPEETQRFASFMQLSPLFQQKIGGIWRGAVAQINFIDHGSRC